MPQVMTCIEDLRVLAKRRVPRMFYDYADSGGWTESTYRANEEDFQRIKLRQRVAVDMTNRTLASTMVGIPVSMPLALAPVGMTGMQHADGEILAARAANKAGVPFTLSTMSICSIETSPRTPTSPSGSSSTSCGTRILSAACSRAPRPPASRRWFSPSICKFLPSATRI